MEKKKVWKSRIDFFNRYGSKVFLEQEEGNTYYLKEDKEALMSMIVAYYPIHKKEIIAIDPSGGPYIAIGTIIEDYEVESITSTKKGFKIKFKDELFQTDKDNLPQQKQ